MWFGCLVETDALMHKPRENLMVREIRKEKRSNGEWQVQMVEKNMVHTSLKGQRWESNRTLLKTSKL